MSSVSSDVFFEDDLDADEAFIQKEILEVLRQRKYEDSEIDRITEMKVAQQLCKERLQDTSTNSQLRQLYMDKLVQLGLQFQSIEEEKRDGRIRDSTIRIRGHTFEVQSSKGRNPVCEVCLTTIWKLMHSWRKCKYCGLRTHEQCSSEVRRECVWVRVTKKQFELNTSICEEKGLAQQHYSCAECAHPLAFDSAAALEPRLCDYTGLYYCRGCHWMDEMPSPARLSHNLDPEPRPVCRAAKQLLTLVDKFVFSFSLLSLCFRRPLISLVSVNAQLTKLNSSLKRMHKIRQDFLYMKCYFISCKTARQLRILQYLCRHQHFVESADLYTMAELRELAMGRLLVECEDIHAVFTRHITRECETCQGNGFCCELCPAKEVIFPFTEGTQMCPKCLAVFHLPCFNHRSRHCPRCERREKRAPPPLRNDFP